MTVLRRCQTSEFLSRAHCVVMVLAKYLGANRERLPKQGLGLPGVAHRRVKGGKRVQRGRDFRMFGRARSPSGRKHLPVEFLRLDMPALLLVDSSAEV